jgi:hypothetical protein
MQDTAGSEQTILLVTVQSNYWLAMGEEFLQAMCAGDAYYPKPIVCVEFRDMAHMTSHVPTGVEGLWAIHPDIVGRLRRSNEIVDKVID